MLICLHSRMLWPIDETQYVNCDNIVQHVMMALWYYYAMQRVSCLVIPHILKHTRMMSWALEGIPLQHSLMETLSRQSEPIT